MNVFVEL